MQNETHSEVTVVDIKMPFISIVVFMIKAALAAIPAIIILTTIVGGVMWILADLGIIGYG